mgnify:CR=1 FL=1
MGSAVWHFFACRLKSRREMGKEKEEIKEERSGAENNRRASFGAISGYPIFLFGGRGDRIDRGPLLLNLRRVYQPVVQKEEGVGRSNLSALVPSFP